jgi:hypothetical protein
MHNLHTMRGIILLLSIGVVSLAAYGQVIPKSYTNIHYDEKGKLYFQKEGQRYYADTVPPRYTIQKILGQPQGTENGVDFNFGEFNGSVAYGLIPYGAAPHPLPVYRFQIPVKDGKVSVNIKNNFKPPYDFTGWQKSQQLTLGYRLIDERGMIVADAVVSLTGTGPFQVVPAILEGPFVNRLSDTGCTISFVTTHPISAKLVVGGKTYGSGAEATHHEIDVSGLAAGRKYEYAVTYGTLEQKYHFTTAPAKGSRDPFVFAYTSDSRHATGGGERMVYGTNAYIVKKMAAVAYQQKAAFVQFTGDMISGYLSNKEEQHLQLFNWKKTLEPFWHYIPFYVGQGNHEALGHIFKDPNGGWKAFVDKFPYHSESAEAVMAEAFVNPLNGPESEDGSRYDPDPSSDDFPSYKENVFYYTYGNVAMIVLNSDYWFAPTVGNETSTGGGLHGYLMDNQMDWLRRTIRMLESDKDIDHIFVTQHTPVFPNGGHSGDDMWYHGNNKKRPFINGSPVEKGIIERRDEYLHILINESKKVLAVLTGDEHNYNRLMLTDKVTIHPNDYPFTKVKVSRPIYQINNGASGAPYYGQEILPWSEHTKAFSVENAVCLFYVNGRKVSMKVINPDTLNEIDSIQLR